MSRNSNDQSDSSTNNDIPHQASVLLRAEICTRLPDGRLSARCVDKVSCRFEILGNSFQDCKEKFELWVKAIEKIDAETLEEIRREAEQDEQEEAECEAA